MNPNSDKPSLIICLVIRIVWRIVLVLSLLLVILDPSPEHSYDYQPKEEILWLSVFLVFTILKLVVVCEDYRRMIQIFAFLECIILFVVVVFAAKGRFFPYHLPANRCVFAIWDCVEIYLMFRVAAEIDTEEVGMVTLSSI